jgi:hypothetical protein
MKIQEASKILDAAIQRLAAERGISYVQALTALAKERPGLVRGYMAVRGREGKKNGNH